MALYRVRQDHVRSVIADSALLSSMEMYAFLLRPGLAALDNLADKCVAGWLLPSKVLDLSYPTPTPFFIRKKTHVIAMLI